MKNTLLDERYAIQLDLDKKGRKEGGFCAFFFLGEGGGGGGEVQFTYLEAMRLLQRGHSENFKEAREKEREREGRQGERKEVRRETEGERQRGRDRGRETETKGESEYCR